jgi:hypothetical protein
MKKHFLPSKKKRRNISSYPFSAVEIKQALRQWREWMVD